jgi:hypothetical protein
MFVSNTADVAITDVQPTEGFTAPVCDDLWTFDNSTATETKFVEDVDPCAVSPSSSITLDPYTSTMFKWDATILGNIGSVFTFCGAVSGTHPDDGPITSGAPSCDSLTVIDPNDYGGYQDPNTKVITDSLYGRPHLYMMFPNPLGDDDSDRGIWGVMVANPTDADIYVSKVVIIATSTRADDGDKIFEASCHTEAESPKFPVTISPTTDKWTCPDDNQLQWKDTSNPQLIKARSVFPFLVKMASGSLSNSVPDAFNILIQPIIFSTLGQYGKAEYGSTMNKEPIAIPNVYLSRTAGSTSDSDIMGELRGIAMGSTITLNAVIADMTTSTTYKINAGTKLIINIPAGLTLDSIVSSNGFDTPVYQVFPDGSSQITGTLSNDIDGGNDAKTIVFKVTAPVFEKAKLYVMRILADGTATGGGGSDYSVGPISETVLQICPAAGCP